MQVIIKVVIKLIGKVPHEPGDCSFNAQEAEPEQHKTRCEYSQGEARAASRDAWERVACEEFPRAHNHRFSERIVRALPDDGTVVCCVSDGGRGGGGGMADRLLDGNDSKTRDAVLACRVHDNLSWSGRGHCCDSTAGENDKGFHVGVVVGNPVFLRRQMRFRVEAGCFFFSCRFFLLLEISSGEEPSSKEWEQDLL